MLHVSLCAARERILSNLQKHPVPRPVPELQQQKAPVAEVPATCLTDSKAAAQLLQQDLSILQDQARYNRNQKIIAHTYNHLFVNTLSHTICHTQTKLFVPNARIAVAREAQQVAMEQELLESLPLLYKNQPEQVTMALECKGKGGQPCQGPANITVTV